MGSSPTTEKQHTNETKNGMKNGNGKTPSKPISLYPMDEEEAVWRLLRVPPPGKDRKAKHT